MEKNRIELEGKVLSFTARPYTRKDGSAAVFREALIQLGNQVVKLSCADVDLAPHEGEDVTLLVEFYSFGDDISAKVRIVGVVE